MESCARVLRVTFILLPALAGCAFSPAKMKKGPGSDPLPPNTTPQGAILRLQRTYENQDATDYEGLLTSDFRYTFSAQTDQDLVNQYGTNWGKDDEVESARHLFSGFTNSKGLFQAPASRIQAAFVNDQYYLDPVHADSATWYVYCPVADVNLKIEVPIEGGGTTTYDISARHAFYLVRGDAAILDPGQPADSTRWYLRHWDDESTPTPGSSPGALPVLAATWGGMKGAYDH